MHLTPQQVDEFRLRGFVSGLRAFEPAAVPALVAEAEALDKSWGRDPPDGMGMEARFPCLLRIATTPSILDVVESILGPDVCLFNTQLIFKDAGDGDFPWHQDACANHAVFADPANVPPHVPLTLRVWLAIDEVDRHNGTLRLCPGSHTRGSLPHSPVRWRDFEHAVHIPPSVFDPGGAEYIELAPGEFCVFHDCAVHGSEANTSRRRRWAMSIHYTRPDVRFDPEHWPTKPLLLRGTDVARP